MLNRDQQKEISAIIFHFLLECQRIVAQNFFKSLQHEAYNMKHNFDIICLLSETYLRSPIQNDNKGMLLNGY